MPTTTSMTPRKYDAETEERPAGLPAGDQHIDITEKSPLFVFALGVVGMSFSRELIA